MNMNDTIDLSGISADNVYRILRISGVETKKYELSERPVTLNL